MQNPYSLVFGRMPSNFIERDSEINEILDTFSEAEPSIRTYILTGIRGCGKTVCLSKIEKTLKEDDSFIIISLNSELPLLESAYEELKYVLHRNHIINSIDFEMSAFGVTVRQKDKHENCCLMLRKMLEDITKHGEKVLFCIDEISNTKNIKVFCQEYNIWTRKEYNVLLIMTGLKRNVLSLQGDDRVSFLKRAEKIGIQSLGINEIKDDYKKVFGISDKKAAEMASFTKGYPYAFQLLGYLCFKSGKGYEDVTDDFDKKMADNVYDIIWDELSPKEREVILAIARSDMSTASIIKAGNMTKEIYNEYRRILITKDILNDEGYGKISFRLPRFGEITLKQTEYALWKIS